MIFSILYCSDLNLAISYILSLIEHTFFDYNYTMAADVIIVGAGIAGLVCAYECANASLDVVLIPGDLEETSSFYARVGLLLHDEMMRHSLMWKIRFWRQIVTPTLFNNFVMLLEFIQWLIDLGVPFDRNSLECLLTKEGAHSVNRIFHVKDYTGHAIINTLYNHLHQHPSIQWVQGLYLGY